MLYLQVARGCASNTLEKHACNVRKVLLFRKATLGANLGPQLDRVLQWLDSLRRQLKYVAGPGHGPTARAMLPHASLVIRWQLLVEAHADSLHEVDLREHGRLYKYATCVALGDAAQLAMMFGYLPPLRLACVRTLLHPDYVHTPGPQGTFCTDPECK